MQEVKVAVEFDAAHEEVISKLSPRSIIEYERTYDVKEVSETNDGWVVTAINRDENVEVERTFEKLPNGYTYEHLSGGFFDELSTTLTVEEPKHDGNRPVRVLITSEFTFGGLLSPIFDRLAVSKREEELKRTIYGLAAELDVDSDDVRAEKDVSQ